MHVIVLVRKRGMWERLRRKISIQLKMGDFGFDGEKSIGGGLEYDTKTG